MIDVHRELIARTGKSREAYEGSKQVLAAEVASTIDMPHPLYVAEAKGPRIVDLDGNVYIDMTMGMGPHILGHAPECVVDAVREAAPRGLQYGIHNPHQQTLARYPVKQVMESRVTTVDPGATLGQAAALMIDAKVGCLPVVDGESLVGIVTEGDFLALMTGN